MYAAGSANPLSAIWCTERRPEQEAERHRDEQKNERERPMFRKESTKNFVNDERQQKNEREIAEIAFAEHDVLERAEIPQTGAAVPKNLFAAFEKAPDVPGQELLQDDAPDTVVEQPIVAAVERPHTAEEAGVVDRDQQERQENDDGRQQKMPRSEPYEHPKQVSMAIPLSAAAAMVLTRTVHGGDKCIASVSGLIAMPKMRRPASAGSMARQPTPLQREKFRPRLPTSTRRASTIRRRQRPPAG